MIAPLMPREPYRADADVPFSTFTLSTSLAFRFQKSKFASQGIHIEQVVVNLPGLAIE